MPYKPTQTMTNSIEHCGARLGCGLCTFTNQPCPFYFSFGGPTCSTPVEITYEADGAPYVTVSECTNEIK